MKGLGKQGGYKLAVGCDRQRPCPQGCLNFFFSFPICSGNFGTVFVDQAYWLGAIASRPSGDRNGQHGCFPALARIAVIGCRPAHCLCSA